MSSLAVLIMRLQVPELTSWHHELINLADETHDKIVAFLGTTPKIIGTRNNPLDFQTRKLMLSQDWQLDDIVPLPDYPTDSQWSLNVDEMIDEYLESMELDSATIYGSNDQVVARYNGKYPVSALPKSRQLSGKQIRQDTSLAIKESADFRRGVIYNAFGRYPTAYPTVDVAITRGTEILLARKISDPDDQWRLIGGFVDPRRDLSKEDAALREAREETGDRLEFDGKPRYLGTALIDDWRYRYEVDSIMTTLYQLIWKSGEPIASDDIAEVQWFDYRELQENNLIVEHRVLLPLIKQIS